jgi:hypothetical protein
MGSEAGRRPERRKTYTLREVVARDLRARHGDGNGLTYVWDGDHGLVTDAENGITTLVTNKRRLPQRGWYELETATCG